jgi:2-oxoglutarate dehydrogenase E1 component
LRCANFFTGTFPAKDQLMLENLNYLESLYSRFSGDQNSVPPEWRNYFDTMGLNGNGLSHSEPSTIKAEAHYNAMLDAKLQSLIRNYRIHGHKIAALDPLGSRRSCPPELKLEFYAFSESELNQLVNLPTLHADMPLTVQEIFERFKTIYCGSIGAEFMHIDDLTMRQWLKRRMENSLKEPALSSDETLFVFRRLTEATGFEHFLRQKFPGAKTFSLEGCEALLPMLDLTIDRASGHGVRDLVVAMAHRGRLNVLVHLAGKKARHIFGEFTDAKNNTEEWHGDVKYHLGHSSDYTTIKGRKVHVSLCFNPSHLEYINPVALGRTRARQDRRGDLDRREVLNLCIHGDAAFAGEGITLETLNLSQLSGYCAGGTVHIILNNQIGFTTLPEEGRSTAYATDVARMLHSPVFHVNGEDLMAVAQVVRMAVDFRHEFQRDVFIDLYGYRRRGHNESDEPSFTQPVWYRQIEKRKNTREQLLEKLIETRQMTAEEAEKGADAYHKQLEQELRATAESNLDNAKTPTIWDNYTGGSDPGEEVDTRVPPEMLAELLGKLSEFPAGFHLHPKLERGMAIRREMAAGKHPLDWAVAELLALATLANEGYRIRLAGQDSARGTFSHRHAIFFDYENGMPFCPLQCCSANKAPVEIVNSPLSEAGALGFEYGYSLDWPDGLVLWEAQFGDFANGAQVFSINLFPAPKANGAGFPGWFFCCRTAMKAWVRSIPAPVSSVFFHWLPETISRSHSQPRRHNCSICCDARLCAGGASRWWF